MVGGLQKKKVIKFNLKDKLFLLLRFVFILNILSLPLYLIVYFNLTFTPFQTLLASFISNLLRFSGYSVQQSEHFIKILYSGGILHAEISWDSTGWKSLYLITALTIATPFINFKNKLKFLSIGLPILFSINIIRIFTTLLIALTYGIEYFDLIHTFLWREGLIFAVLFLWLLWINHYLKIKKTKFIFREYANRGKSGRFK
ncbi:MAG: exosortase/archaeosortase family protein [Candidatus Aenigmatarchaeota archaeon]